jgi:phospholipase/carboxylesterase
LSYLLKFPTEIQALASLSGFMPVGGRRLVFPGLLSEKRVFIAHGARDELVSVSNAREAAEILDLAGATVTYCEDDVGHKLSASCFRGLEAFFQDLNEI